MSETTDLRIYKTKKALVEAMRELMNEKTFDAITVNELCDRALVRRATFYKHFLDKYDFFSYFIRYYRAEYIRNLPEPTDKTSLATYCFFHFESFIRFICENRSLIDNALKSSLLPVLLDIFSEEIESHILETIRKNRLWNQNSAFSPEVFSAFYAGGMISIVRRWIKNPAQITEKELRESMAALLDSMFHA